MPIQNEKSSIQKLQTAYRKKNLTLYLGAGVSVANGIPSWDRLVLAMYFSAIKSGGIDEALRPFPNYLFAIAEWHLERRREPLDITARKIRNLYRDEQLFLKKLRQTLYAGFMLPDTGTIRAPDVDLLLRANTSLNALANLCKKSNRERSSVHAVITYNYDNLLEIALADTTVQSIWRGQENPIANALPIYHVHGFIPIKGPKSDPKEIVFTEEQYHLAAQNAYSWSNLVQIKCLSSSVGLMIGLSLTDRNMRRLLDTLRKAPITSENYILLQKPKWAKPNGAQLRQIDEKAKAYFDRFQRSGIKSYERKYEEITQIIEDIEERDLDEQQSVLEELGVRPIWYKDHKRVAEILNQLMD